MHKPNKLLEAAVREELLWDPHLDDRRVVVRAKNGRVRLSGWVPNCEQRAVAVDDTWAKGGVRDVDDELLVGVAGEPAVDADLAEVCRRAIRAGGLVPDGAVKVSVTAGRATLLGEVRRLYQRTAAERAVRRADGILGITNNVAVTDDPVPSDVAHRIHKALRRQALLDGSPLQVTNEGHTVFLDGTVKSERARHVAEKAASAAPRVREVVDRLSVATDRKG
jgi:osmotically-inducible protein OsmY